MGVSSGSGHRNDLLSSQAPGAQTPQGMQVDEQIDQGVKVGDRAPIAQTRALDTQGDGLGIDALGGGALGVHGLVVGAAAVELVAQARAGAGSQSRATAGALAWPSQRASTCLHHLAMCANIGVSPFWFQASARYRLPVGIPGRGHFAQLGRSLFYVIFHPFRKGIEIRDDLCAPVASASRAKLTSFNCTFPIPTDRQDMYRALEELR